MPISVLSWSSKVLKSWNCGEFNKMDGTPAETTRWKWVLPFGSTFRYLCSLALKRRLACWFQSERLWWNTAAVVLSRLQPIHGLNFCGEYTWWPWTTSPQPWAPATSALTGFVHGGPNAWVEGSRS
jgi:hypothetical protein